MNDSRLSKLIKFEGAGWAGADTSKATDMGNCRVRTTFVNDHGKKIYLEMGYFDNRERKSKSRWHYGYDMPWRIDFLFYCDRDRSVGCSEEFKDDYRMVREFNKKNVLEFINRVCEASFEEIETVNWEKERSGDYWDGFSHTGKEEDDFHKRGE